jgi:hypothetical protein
MAGIAMTVEVRSRPIREEMGNGMAHLMIDREFLR